MSAQPSAVSALGRALVQQGRLVQADANAIQAEAAKGGISFVQQLVQAKKLSAKEVSLFAIPEVANVSFFRGPQNFQKTYCTEVLG